MGIFVKEGHRVNRGRRILVSGLGVMLVAAAIEEHLSRGLMARRLHETLEGRRQLELQFGEVLATHQQITSQLKNEQQRSQQLSTALADAQKKLEETTARLAAETRTVHELEQRLASTQHEASQLQGELAVALQQTGQKNAQAESSSAVQLERVVVSDVSTPALQGRVVSVHRDWNFVVIDLGWDAVRIGDMVSIFHNDQLLAKARIERVQEGVAAATLLPEWQKTEIHVNDLVRVL